MKTIAVHAALARLAFIAGKLRNYERVTCSDVASEFEVSTKTAQRDYDFLRDRLGWDVDYVREEHSFQLVHAPEPVLL